MLVRTIPETERILGYGGPSTGKTHMWMTIARLWQNTETPGKFHVIDTDFTTSTMLAKEEFSGLENIQKPRVCLDYVDIFNYVNELEDTASEGDWITFDMAGNLYELARDYFSEQAYKMSEVDKMLEHRLSGSKGVHFDGFTDWPMVRSMHDAIIKKLVHISERKGVHLFATAPEKVIVTEAGSRSEKDSTILSVFGSFGARPDGHKKLPHWYHDVVYLKKTKDSRSIAVPKSRLREPFQQAELKDFATQYLLGVDVPGKWVAR